MDAIQAGFASYLVFVRQNQTQGAHFQPLSSKAGIDVRVQLFS